MQAVYSHIPEGTLLNRLKPILYTLLHMRACSSELVNLSWKRREGEFKDTLVDMKERFFSAHFFPINQLYNRKMRKYLYNLNFFFYFVQNYVENYLTKKLKNKKKKTKKKTTISTAFLSLSHVI